MDDPDAKTPSAPQVESGTDPAPGTIAPQGPPTVPPENPAPGTQPAPSPVVSSPAVPPPQVTVSGSGGKGRRLLKFLLILLVVAAVAAGGWYFYQKDKDNGQGATATQSKDVPLLKVGVVDADFGDLYPNMPLSSYATLTNTQMFEGLVRYEGGSKIVPALASTWTNPDDKTWLFTIKPNVKFHDGHTLAPSDVKYSLDTIIATRSDVAQAFADSIASVTVEGRNQVKITTKEPDPVLLNKLTFLYVIDANLPKGAEPSQAGTGPYEIKSGTAPTATSVQMTAFNEYHGGKPKTQALDFSTDQDPDKLVKEFKDHKLDIVGPVPTEDAKKAPGIYTFTAFEPNVDYIAFNFSKPGPLQNKAVREAIRYAVNAQTIGKASGNPTTPISQVIPPSIAGYNPSITPYKQNIAKAKQLLAQAGYPNGVALRLSTSGNQGASEEIVKNLKEAGITVTLDYHEDFDEFIDYFTDGQAEMFKVNYVSDTLDGADIVATTLAEPNYNNPKLTELLAQIDTTTDPAKRLKLLQQAETLIDQDVALVPLYSDNEVWLMDKDYRIVQDMPSALISVYFYKVQLK